MASPPSRAVIYEVDWEPAAVDLASRYLMDDPEGLGVVSAVIVKKGQRRLDGIDQIVLSLTAAV